MILDPRQIIGHKMEQYIIYCLNNFQGDQNYELMSEAIGCSFGVIRDLPTGTVQDYILINSEKIISSSQKIDKNSSTRQKSYDQDHRKLVQLLTNDTTDTVKQCLNLCLTKFKEDVREHYNNRSFTSFTDRQSKKSKVMRPVIKKPSIETILEEKEEDQKPSTPPLLRRSPTEPLSDSTDSSPDQKDNNQLEKPNLQPNTVRGRSASPLSSQKSSDNHHSH